MEASIMSNQQPTKSSKMQIAIGILLSLWAMFYIIIDHYYQSINVILKVLLSLFPAFLIVSLLFLVQKCLVRFKHWLFVNPEETLQIIRVAKNVSEYLETPKHEKVADCVRVLCQKNRFAVKPLVRDFLKEQNPLSDKILKQIYDYYYEEQRKPLEDRKYSGIITDFVVETVIEEDGWETLSYKMTVLQTRNTQRLFFWVCDEIPTSLQFRVDRNIADPWPRDISTTLPSDLSQMFKEKRARLHDEVKYEKGRYFDFTTQKGFLRSYEMIVRSRLPVFEEESDGQSIYKFYVPLVDCVFGGQAKVHVVKKFPEITSYKLWHYRGGTRPYCLVNENDYIVHRSRCELYVSKKPTIENIRQAREISRVDLLEVVLNKGDSQLALTESPIFDNELAKKWKAQFAPA